MMFCFIKPSCFLLQTQTIIKMASNIKEYKNKRPMTSPDFFEEGFHSNNSYINSIADQIVSCFGFLIAYIIIK